jgi:hypothetical protein
MLTMVVRIAWTIAHLIGMPVLAWWLSGLIVNDPPLVAPFLFASPLYAMAAFGGIMYAFGMKKWDEPKTPLEPSEFESIAEAHPTVFSRYVGKVGLVADETLTAGAMVWKGWLFVEEDLWHSLAPSAREFMLVRVAQRSPGPWWSWLLKNALFLAFFVLACINLWFVILLHVSLAISLAVYTMSTSRDYEEKRDRRTLGITRNYDAARQYVKAIKLDGERRRARLESLRESAIELGLV